MNDKVVLPRFVLPGESTHGAIRALWVAGGMVVLATLVLGLAMWRHRSIEIATAEQAAAKAAAARRAALEPVPTPKPAPAAGAVGGPGAPILANQAVAAAAPPAPRAEEAAPAPRARRHSSKLASKSNRSKATVRMPSEERPSKRSSSKDDVIDRLLNQYK